ncbi:RNA polymerase sigma factor [Mucilaginibacter rubeus]|uniref:RNA polymerase sigma factor n=1 Tax=Mucilaginibacter rubeus TaxID=2027860 RepID=UPI0016662916|nr:RNA polymerase sigma-70 factor [Mucilaginibacter rubeus]
MASIYGAFDDHQLADLLTSDDEAAFVEIYERYWSKLYIVARNRLNDSCEAEEVVQDIFYSLWRNRRSFELIKGFDNYFLSAVKFGVINRLSKKARRVTYSQEIAERASEIDESTTHQLDLLDLQQHIQVSLSSLPDKCREIFNLKYVQGYSQRQIAEELTISEKTVEAHLSRARKKLKGTFFHISLFLISIFLLFSQQ